MSSPTPGSEVQAAVRRDLTTALRARDRVAVAALRSLAAALANAEAVPPTAAGGTGGTGASAEIAGGVVGLGATEAERRELDADTVETVVTAEITERTDAATAYRSAGADDRANALLAEADLLRRYRRD